MLTRAVCADESPCALTTRRWQRAALTGAVRADGSACAPIDNRRAYVHELRTLHKYARA